jgi:hypothetical protein
VARVTKICRVLRLAFFFSFFVSSLLLGSEATLAHFQSIILIIFFSDLIFAFFY